MRKTVVAAMNGRKVDLRRQKLERAAVSRRAQALKEIELLIAVWNESQAKRMPMLFSPMIGAAIAARFGFCGFAVPAAA